MDNKALEIKPVSLGPWVTPEYQNKQESQGIKPVVMGGEGPRGSTADEADTQSQSGEPAGAISPEQTRELVENARSYLSDLNIGLSFELYEKTGELVVKVINRDTQEVIRQMPPEDLLKIHDKLAELRGVLFDGKV